MSVVLITGIGGLIGSETAEFYGAQGADVVGLDNDMRQTLFGVSVRPRLRQLTVLLGNRLDYHDRDIRDREALMGLFREYGSAISLVIHTAAQPSHDYAARDPYLDWSINAGGTQHLLDAARRYAPEAVFAFLSTNKVYGDWPNALTYREEATRYECADALYRNGINESMPIDRCNHSLFGASKVAADVLVQEYGRAFGMKTVCFRGGCLTGAHHAGAQLHGFLAYLMQCAIARQPYTVIGYGGKQVRDNLHARDVARAIDAFYRSPQSGAVYNLGGGRDNSLSVLEAIDRAQTLTGQAMDAQHEPTPRRGDHQWWITDMGKFRRDYPDWQVTASLDDILAEMVAAQERVA